MMEETAYRFVVIPFISSLMMNPATGKNPNAVSNELRVPAMFMRRDVIYGFIYRKYIKLKILLYNNKIKFLNP
jgi:hypothetical protein